MSHVTSALQLPDELLPYQATIEATLKPFIQIEAQVAPNLPLWQSKFGGFPYFPKDWQYPKDSQGKPMHLLAQINFAEMPPLDSFPTAGILQFYISGEHDLYGACFENPAQQDDFRVLYFPNVTEDEAALLTAFDFLPNSYQVPLDRQCALTFTVKFAPLPVTDYQFEEVILGIDRDAKYTLLQHHEDICEMYQELFSSQGHKIGGYPFFTQSDPREFDPYGEEAYQLLLQIDTDDDAGIMWGDCGVANFFISPADLERKDFSKVFYNWDCC